MDINVHVTHGAAPSLFAALAAFAQAMHAYPGETPQAPETKVRELTPTFDEQPAEEAPTVKEKAKRKPAAKKAAVKAKPEPEEEDDEDEDEDSISGDEDDLDDMLTSGADGDDDDEDEEDEEPQISEEEINKKVLLTIKKKKEANDKNQEKMSAILQKKFSGLSIGKLSVAQKIKFLAEINKL